MHGLDWVILIGFFVYTIWDGLRLRKHSRSLHDLLLAGRSLPWWAIGFSVMATQASAITFIGTTGQAYMHDLKFIQVYLGLPIAMVILSVTLVPFFHRLKVYTAYEILEQKFGLKVRLSTSFLFLLSRAIGLGITIAAPSYVLALILHVPLWITIIFIGIGATFYTMFGGIQGVIRTDIKQMVLMLSALAFCFAWIIYQLPPAVSGTDALQLAGSLGKLESIDLSFDPGEKYNLWSGLIAGLFLMLSYFGADQSQVQRYLTARSLADARGSLLMSAILKVPMQFMVLLLGVYLYVFYVFSDRPLLFIPDQGAEASVAQIEFQALHEARQQAALSYLASPDGEATRANFVAQDRKIAKLRKREIARLELAAEASRNDTNYVFPYFILHELPIGLVGLIVAAILAAALSSIDSMLNSLAAVSIIDGYQRLHPKPRSDLHYVQAAHWVTAFWGGVATLSALVFGETESVIELTNQLGSYFYGPILGVFLLLWLPRASTQSVMWGLGLGLLGVMIIGSWQVHCTTGVSTWFFPFGNIPDDYHPAIEYLWLNPIGTCITFGIGALGKLK